MNEAPYGYHPGTRIPRKSPENNHHEGKGTCKYCGQRGLVWEQTEAGWRLLEVGGHKHVCPPKE